MKQRCISFFRSRQTVEYALVEPSLRDGDIILYDYSAADSIQSGAAPIKRTLLNAALLSHLCSLLPWNACTSDVGDAREPAPAASVDVGLNEVDVAEMHMEHSWRAWQHATLVVIVRDETKESNPQRAPNKMLPYVFVPNAVSKLALIPLRTLLKNSASRCFAVRHLLINENEMALVNPDGGGASNSPPNVPPTNKQQKSLTTSTRSFIQRSILDLFIDIAGVLKATSSADDVEDMLLRAEIIDLLLHQPAPARRGVLKSSVLSASHEFVAHATAADGAASSHKTPTPSGRPPPYSELLSLMHVSPAYLALLALYNARVTTLLPRAHYGAAHLCDSGLVDRFVAPAYSYSDETIVRL